MLPPGPSASRLRMVYNCRDSTNLGGTELIGAGVNAYRMAWGMLALLIFAALAATTLAGCGGGTSQSTEKQQASEQKSGDAGSSERAAAGHPALGSADAPVVLTEYSDYQ
jgi:hypothetical protein